MLGGGPGGVQDAEHGHHAPRVDGHRPDGDCRSGDAAQPVATIDLDYIFPGANTLLALVIAFTKMTCVMLFFMHVYWSPRMIWLAAIASFFWLAIMFAYTMQDYLTRSQGVFSG